MNNQQIAVYNSPEKERFELAWRAAQAFAGSTLVPEGMRTRENCMVAIMLADEMGESRLSVMQNLFQVYGRFGWITAYMVSRANRSGKFKGALRWQTRSKDPLEVECYADLADAPEDDRRVSIAIDLKTAEESGWTTYTKNNQTLTHARWATPLMQEQMLRWRTASWLIRLYAPECMMGLPTKEELEDISEREMVDVTPPEPMPKLDEFTEPKEPPKRRSRAAKAELDPTPPQDTEDDPVMLYELTNCDGETVTCTTATVEENLLAILAEAQQRGPKAIEAAIENNRPVVEELQIESLTLELAQMRGMIAREPDPPPRAAGAPAEFPKTAANPTAAPPQGRADFAVHRVYAPDSKGAYRTWWLGPFFQSLRKATTKREFKDLCKASDELIEAYYATLSPPARIAAQRELDELAKGLGLE